MKKTLPLAVFAVVLLFELPLYAYLDPGVGSMLLQILAALALAIGIGWRFIAQFIKKIVKKDTSGGSDSKTVPQMTISNRESEDDVIDMLSEEKDD